MIPLFVRVYALPEKRLLLISRLLEGLIYIGSAAEPLARSDKVKVNGYHGRREEAELYFRGWDSRPVCLWVSPRAEDLDVELLET